MSYDTSGTGPDIVQAYVVGRHMLPSHLGGYQLFSNRGKVVVDHGTSYAVYPDEEVFLREWEWVA